MKKISLVIWLAGINALLISAQQLNHTIPDPESGEAMLVGHCNRDGMTSDPYSEWFAGEYDQYIADQGTLGELNLDLFYMSEISVVLGTWCSDSKREIPRFIKILDELQYEVDAVNFICVDRNKEADVPGLQEMGIELVPTIIFSVDGEEIGRIIESPHESLEADMVDIF